MNLEIKEGLWFAIEILTFYIAGVLFIFSYIGSAFLFLLGLLLAVKTGNIIKQNVIKNLKEDR